MDRLLISIADELEILLEIFLETLINWNRWYLSISLNLRFIQPVLFSPFHSDATLNRFFTFLEFSRFIFTFYTNYSFPYSTQMCTQQKNCAQKNSLAFIIGRRTDALLCNTIQFSFQLFN